MNPSPTIYMSKSSSQRSRRDTPRSRYAAGAVRWGCRWTTRQRVAAINKGHSKNYLANDLLCALFDTADGAGISVSAQWVPTHAQRADEFTRGTVASPCPVPLAPLPARYAAVAAISR